MCAVSRKPLLRPDGGLNRNVADPCGLSRLDLWSSLRLGVAARRLVRAITGRGRARSAGGRVNHVALGTFCHAAAALRTAGLRRWAGPFDWIFSTPDLIAACLTDDCATLFDPGHLVSVPSAERTHGAKRQCRHPVYEARYNLPIVFNHHDPAASSADRRRLLRAAARLRRALRQDTNVFYLISEVSWPETHLRQLACALARQGPGNVMAVVTLTAGAAPRGVAIVDSDMRGCRRLDVRVATRSRSRGIAFADPRDDEHLTEVLRATAARFDPTLNRHN